MREGWIGRSLLAWIFVFGCGGPEELEEEATSTDAVTCGPRMYIFPVAAPHNIGFDRGSCGSTCAVSCPDQNANSDWGGSHHGIDVFAHRGAPLVAVADGTIVRVGRPSRTSGLRVRLRDSCGWEYYYGHLDGANVSQGQRVSAGQQIGTMGNSGTSGVHLHFNVSPNGNYSHDINPFELLRNTSATACSGAQPQQDFQPLHRHWNPFIGDHYYSLDPITNGAYGYGHEGSEGSAARSPLPGTVPLHQLFLANDDHLYTVNDDEVQFAISLAYHYDGVVAHVLPAGSGNRPVHRYFNPFIQDHFYTATPIPEGAYGYGYEGVAWETP
jgi:hypothetical protein